MNCQEFRTLVGAQPHANPADAALHIAQCSPCTRYREEVQALDRLIYRALNVKVATPLPQRSRAWRQPAWSLAASMLLTVSIVTTAWLLTPSGTFADQLVAHTRHEQYALVRTPQVVESDHLRHVLQQVGLRLKPGTLQVSYARSCWFHGHFVPHLVVQTELGPAAVLILTKEVARDGLGQFAGEGFSGVVLPAPRGVIVVLGEQAIVDGVSETVLDALEYESAGQRLG